MWPRARKENPYFDIGMHLIPAAEITENILTSYPYANAMVVIPFISIPNIAN
jgi:hypothetical protein